MVEHGSIRAHSPVRVGHRRPLSSEALPASHSALPPDLGRWRNRPICSRVSHNAQPRLGRQGGGKVNSSKGCVMPFHQAAPDGGLLRLRLRPGAGVATPWNGFFAPGLLAALIVVTLAEGLSGLKAPAGMPARPRHRAIAEREELR